MMCVFEMLNQVQVKNVKTNTGKKCSLTLVKNLGSDLNLIIEVKK